MQRSWRILLTSIGLVLVGLCSFGAGVVASPAVNATLGGVSATATTPAIAQQFQVFWQVWNLVSSNYVDTSKINVPQMTTGAIRGMLATLDDPGHTRYLTKNEYESQQNSLEGRFTGIGVSIEQRNNQIVVQQVFANSPAYLAGLKLGDVIVSIDGKSTTGLATGDVGNLIRGPEGSTVTLVIQHANDTAQQTVTLTRRPIRLDSVTWQMLPQTTVADIAIGSFSDGTAANVKAALAEAKKQGATRFIIDVRDDPGGLLDESVAVSSLFLSSGTVLVQRDAHGDEHRYLVQSGAVETSDPLVVLINHNTASAAEIFAAALRDNHRSQLIGSTTLGTGTVLSTYRLLDGSALLLGTAEWLTPNGQSLWKKGVSPDVSVDSPNGTVVLRPETLEFPNAPLPSLAQEDPTLARGLELVQTTQASH